MTRHDAGGGIARGREAQRGTTRSTARSEASGKSERARGATDRRASSVTARTPEALGGLRCRQPGRFMLDLASGEPVVGRHAGERRRRVVRQPGVGRAARV